MRKLNIQTLMTGLLLFLLYWGAGALCFKIRSMTNFMTFIWLPSGIGLAFLYLVGPFLWPAILLASFVIAYFYGNHTSFVTSTLIAIACSLESYLGAYFLKRFASRKLRFVSVKEVFVFIGFVLVFSSGLSSLIEAIGLYLGEVSDPEKLTRLWRSWWLGQAMGELIVGAGIIFFWNDRRRWRELKGRSVEAISLLVVLSTYCCLIFTNYASYNTYLLVRPYVLFSLMAWAAIRFEVIGVMFANFVIVITVVWGCLQNYIAFPTYVGPDYAIMLQLYASALVTTGLILGAAVREKSDLLEFRNEFLGVASHELKTPITSLKLNLQLLERRLKADSQNSSESVVFLGKIDKQINRLVQIVEQLLDVSQAERRKISLNVEEVQLRKLMDALVERLRGELSNSKTSIQLKISDGILGFWDPFRVEQVMENLISNGIKYAPGKPILIEATEKGGVVEILVSDRGPGIEEAMQSQIFDQFVRATINPHVKGLGLGLFITRSIVEAHGGKIGVKSKLGMGTIFSIHLPIHSLYLTSPKSNS